MSSIVSSLTGGVSGNSGAAGMNYQAGAADIHTPTTDQQALDQYNNAQSGIGNQISFLNAVQQQNGLGNQTNVYNQLQGVVNGTGPNPAQAQLAQATAANTANTAALMAGQRGASANPGLIARQAAQQGAANQQQAAGQAATLQAQQSLGALGQSGQMATNMANQQANATNAFSNASQGEQGLVLNSIAGQNSANVGSQQSMNSSNAGIAGVVAGGQQQLIGNVLGGAGMAFGLAEGGTVPHMADGGGTTELAPATTSDAATGAKSKLGQFFNNMNAQPQSSNQGMAQAGQAIGKGIGTAAKGLYNYISGSGGTSTPPVTSDQNEAMMNQYGIDTTPNAAGISPQQQFDAMQGTIPSASAASAIPAVEDIALEADGGMMQTAMKLAPMIAMLNHGGRVPAMLSPGERYLSPEKVEKVAKGADPIKEGKKVPGKPKVKGSKNSYANDTVPATLQEGGIVLPRSVTESKHPHWAAHKFVSAIMAKQGKTLPAKGK